jgi:hypothetical protein
MTPLGNFWVTLGRSCASGQSGKMADADDPAETTPPAEQEPEPAAAPAPPAEQEQEPAPAPEPEMPAPSAAEMRDQRIAKLLNDLEEIANLDIDKLTVVQLQARLRAMKLAVGENKADLVARLTTELDEPAIFYEWCLLSAERSADGDDMCSICLDGFHNNKFTTRCTCV